MYEVLDVDERNNTRVFTVIDYSDFVVESFTKDIIEDLLRKGIRIEGVDLSNMDIVSHSKWVICKTSDFVLVSYLSGTNPSLSVVEIRNHSGDKLYSFSYANNPEGIEVGLDCMIHTCELHRDRFLEVQLRYFDKDYGVSGTTMLMCLVFYCVGSNILKPVSIDGVFIPVSTLGKIGFNKDGDFVLRNAVVKIN